MLFDDSASFPVRSRIRRFSWMHRLATAILLLACLFVASWIARASLLRGMAQLWIVSDVVTPANAAVVLGGNVEVRPFAAADLYRRGLVNKILISQVDDDRVVSLGIVTNHTELNRQVLLKLGVPANAIEVFGVVNKNTMDEAVALRAWAERNDASTFIIPTEIFSARRVQFIFRRVLAAGKVEVLSLEPPQYTKDGWWKTDTGIIAFQNEILKYIYYRFKYRT
jgi:uncharacterized SAM-binding protein YcdF (DUF218 family)